MAAGHPSQADCRRAVRGVLPPVGVVLAAVSGGPDSLALAAALAAREVGLPGPFSIARRLIEHWYGGPLPVAQELRGSVRG